MALTEKEKNFLDFVCNNKRMLRTFSYANLEEPWSMEENGQLTICTSPINPKKIVDERIIYWNTVTGEKGITGGKVGKEQAEKAVELMSNLYKRYKGELPSNANFKY